jgi:hypothetical protein
VSGGHRVYNKPICQAVQKWFSEDENNTLSELARRLGWYKSAKDRRPDTMRITRSIGLSSSHSYADGQRYVYLSKNIGEDNAIRILEAIGRAPNEFDL